MLDYTILYARVYDKLHNVFFWSEWTIFQNIDYYQISFNKASIRACKNIQ